MEFLKDLYYRYLASREANIEYRFRKVERAGEALKRLRDLRNSELAMREAMNFRPFLESDAGYFAEKIQNRIQK